jgi:type VI protein secretion system component VasF
VSDRLDPRLRQYRRKRVQQLQRQRAQQAVRRREILRGAIVGVLFLATVAAFVASALMFVRSLESSARYLCEQVTVLAPAVHIGATIVFSALTGALGAATFGVWRDE